MRTVVAENLLLKQQLLVLSRPVKRGIQHWNLLRLMFAAVCQFIRRTLGVVPDLEDAEAESSNHNPTRMTR